MIKKSSLSFILLFLSWSLLAQNIPRSNCDSCWNPDSLGSHRVIITFDGSGNIAKVVIPWRRRDLHPELKRIIMEDAKTHQKVLNVKAVTISRESGEIDFEPVSGKGMYYIYYLPYKNEGHSNYPKGIYLKPENTASAEWLTSVENDKDIPLAKVNEIQSVNAFNSFYPMEIIATKEETDNLIGKARNQSYLKTACIQSA